MITNYFCISIEYYLIILFLISFYVKIICKIYKIHLVINILSHSNLYYNWLQLFSLTSVCSSICFFFFWRNEIASQRLQTHKRGSQKIFRWSLNSYFKNWNLGWTSFVNDAMKQSAKLYQEIIWVHNVRRKNYASICHKSELCL